MNMRILLFMLMTVIGLVGCQQTPAITMTPTPDPKAIAPTSTRIVVTEDMLVRTTPTTIHDVTYQQWYLERIRASVLNDYDVPAVRVAIIDTGIDATHADLASQISETKDIFSEPTMQDRQGHGTHTAGIIAAQPNIRMQTRGICPSCQIVAIKAINDDGYGSDVTVAQGIDYAIEANAVVINLSVGSGNDSPAIKAAIERAIAADILIVAATGNSLSRDAETIFPAAYPGVLAVSAIDKNDQLAAFARSGVGIDIVAPGVDIFSTSPFGEGYSTEQGTSTAAPQVTAVAAIVRALRPEFSAQQTQELILAHTIDLGDPGYDAIYGHGLLDVSAVMNAIREPSIAHRGQVRGRLIGAEAAAVQLKLDTQPITLDPNAQFLVSNLMAGTYTLTLTYANQQVEVPIATTGIGLFVTDINIWIRNGTITPEVNEQLP